VTLKSEHLRRRAAALLGLEGGVITYRRTTRKDGYEPYPNPPRNSGALTLASTLTAGATSLVLGASALVGRIIAGDRFRLGATIPPVEAQAEALDDGANRITVPLTFAAPATIASGTAVTPIWSADREIKAVIAPMSRRLREDVLLETRDLQITIAGADISFEPYVQDRVVLPGGDVREVVAIMPMMVDGFPFAWRLQVR
jgi:hypothetical protein